MSDHDPQADPSIVEDLDEAARCGRPPLLVRRTVEEYLDRQGIGSGPLRAQRIGGGFSNITFLVQRDDFRAVLRRPPRPPFHRTAHDVLREARIQRALEPTVARVPRIIHTCTDPAVLGVPFYLMEEIHGTVITSSFPESLDDASGRSAVAHELIDALVELHDVDTGTPALQEIDRGPGYVDRQLRRWGAVWRESKTREVPGMDEVEAWLHRHRPPEPAVRTIVHGDYRLGNVVFAGGAPARLRSILDWEIGTVGDPLVDVGTTLMNWPEAGEDSGTLLSMAGAVARDGTPTRADLVERYASRSGRALDDLGWYVVFAFWRAAVGLEVIYARRSRYGNGPNDIFLLSLSVGIPELIARARESAAAYDRSG